MSKTAPSVLIPNPQTGSFSLSSGFTQGPHFSLWTPSNSLVVIRRETRMFMSDRKNRVKSSSTITFTFGRLFLLRLARSSLQRTAYTRRTACVPERTGLFQRPEGLDAVRLFLLRYALEHSAGAIQAEHFTIFRKRNRSGNPGRFLWGQARRRTGPNRHPYQSEALKILQHCLFTKAKTADRKDVTCYLRLFCGEKAQLHLDQDRTCASSQ